MSAPVLGIPVSPASAAMDALGAALPSVDLPTVLERAELQDRVDTKYVLFPAVLGRLVERLETELETAVDVLDIDGRRRFAYESRYLDTADLRTFRDHLQGRRRRFKVRTRSYLDTGGSHLELKEAGAGSGTQKMRWPLPDQCVADVPGRAPEVIAALRDELAGRGYPPMGRLDLALTTTYARTTLVGRHRSFRLTVDTDLVCAGAQRPGSARLHALHDRVLLEVKTPSPRDRIHRLLSGLGARPVAVSKFGVGLGLTRGLSTAPWADAVSRHLQPQLRRTSSGAAQGREDWAYPTCAAGVPDTEVR